MLKLPKLPVYNAPFPEQPHFRYDYGENGSMLAFLLCQYKYTSPVTQHIFSSKEGVLTNNPNPLKQRNFSEICCF